MAAASPSHDAADAPVSALDRLTRAAPWIARAGWLVVAVVTGAAVETALHERSGAVIWTVTISGWLLWAVVMLALAIPSVRSLTIVRVGVPLAVLVAVIAATSGAGPVAASAGVAAALVTSISTATAEFGRQFVQASAYGDEERFLLRMPAAAGVAAIVLWVPWAAAVIAGPLLIAARSWVAGVVVTAVALAGTVLLLPRWHRLSQRWFVFVPAGVVLHDPVVLADTLPLRTAQVTDLQLASADTQAADLTGPASGYALELSLIESVTAVFAFTPSHPNGRAIHLRAMLIAPSRPGQVLLAARRRGLRVE